jgi:CubicO group peptidase (beta-lactamase class C family)
VQPKTVTRHESHTSCIKAFLPGFKFCVELITVGLTPDNHWHLTCSNAGRPVLAAVRKYNLVHPPSWRPLYSNTGPGVLGMALLAADRAARATGEGGPDTVAQLLCRDVFIPLGMNGSHFLATPENLARLVVPAVVGGGAGVSSNQSARMYTKNETTGVRVTSDLVRGGS